MHKQQKWKKKKKKKKNREKKKKKKKNQTNYKQSTQAQASNCQPAHTQRQPRSSGCRNCGGIFPHRYGPCPVKGQSCNACNKPNHYAKVFRNKQRKRTYPRRRRINEIQTETGDPHTETNY